MSSISTGGGGDVVRILIDAHTAVRANAEIAALNRTVRDTGVAAKEAAVGTRELHHRSFLANQALFTMRRYLYQATLALTAIGAAAVVVGFKFDAMRERTVTALSYLLKSTAGARAEFRELLHIARDTSFSPTQVIQAGQQLIAFGFNAETANRALRDMGDAISALNLPQDTVDRIILALGQIRVKGRVTGEELRQLANANIPAYDYLARAFGRTRVQLGRIADANIPAAQGIKAILRGLENQYGGAAKSIRHTTSFQFEQLKGDLQVILGAITNSAFKKLGSTLESFTAVTGKMFNAVVDNNAGFMDLVDIVDKATNGSIHLRLVIETLGDFFGTLFRSIGIVIKAFGPAITLMLLFAFAVIKVITWISKLFEWVNTLTTSGIHPLTFALQVLGVYLLIVASAAIVSAAATAKDTAAKIINTFVTNRNKAAQIGLAAATFIVRGAALAAATAMAILTGAEVTAVGIFALAVVAVLAIAAALGYLEYKYGVVSKAVQYLWDKLIAFNDWVSRHDPIKKFVGQLPFGNKSGIDIVRGFFQHGGTAGTAGRYVVGEHGPEVVNLPAGARVTPVAQRPMDWSGVAAAGGGGMNITIYPADVNIDGRKIAEVVFKHRADRIARR